MKNYHDMALALAGLCQAAALINQLATKGEVESQEALRASLYSLLQTEPENTLAVYAGRASNLKLGLETLIEQFTTMDNANISSYWSNLLGLESSLNRDDLAKRQLSLRIQRLPQQLEFHHHDLLNEQVLSIFANIYIEVISPLGRKINIIGEARYLQQQLVQDKVRACLLAGIRAAVLWRQVGGSKWWLLFNRGKIVKAAQEIYSNLYS